MATNTIEPWKLTQIVKELEESYASCQNSFERGLWQVYASKDCKRILNGRKPTPGEQSILDRFNLRPDLATNSEE